MKANSGKAIVWILVVTMLITFMQSFAFGEETAEAIYQTQIDGEWESGTFADALSKVYEGGVVKLLKDIELVDTVILKKKVTITSEDASSVKKITSSIQQHGYLFCILDEITIENMIIDGGAENSVTASSPMISVGNLIKSGKLILGEGSVLCNNNNIAERGAGGAVCVIFGELVLDGGQIIKNSAYAGSAIAVVTDNANVVINTGSIISENNATDSGYYGGGAIFISAGTVTMTGGEIKNNNAVNCGGAVFINKGDDTSHAVFKLQGGTVTANTANYGAGIYASTSNLIELSGGFVSGNTADKDGGGIYAVPDNVIAISGSVVVDDNTASENGANMYLLYGPAFTVGQLSNTAKVDIFTVEKPETGGELLIAGPLEGYTLTAGDISSLSYEDAGYSFKLSNGNIVLAAVPVVVTYTVQFETNGGSVTPESAETVEGKLESLPVPTRSGYRFDGWYDAETGGKKITTDTVFTENTTVYAQWTKKSSGGGGGSSPATYTVKFETNGGNEINSIKVIRNKTADEPTAPLKDGYTFDGWYTDEELTAAYDFETKVTKAITLYAKWTENEAPDTDDKKDETDDRTDTPDTPVWQNPFTDVETDDWYYADARYAAENGLMEGMTATTFAPDGIITRAMMVTVLYRNEGEPEVTGTATFEDVDAGAYYAKAVIWGQQNGIIKGYSETEFAPDQNITREQIAAIMHRYAQYKGYDVSAGENTNILSYSDFDSISGYAIASMQYVVGSGLMKGKTISTLNPQDFATRAEIAAIMHRFIEADK